MTDALMYAVNKSDLNTTALITDFDSNTPHMAIRKNLHSAKTALERLLPQFDTIMTVRQR
jgi:hypothetical protein